MFQMALYKTEEGKYYLYGACFGGTKNGLMISDVTDPKNPQFIKHFQLVDPKEYPTTTTPKLQIADDLMICAMSAGSGPDALVDQSELKNMKCEVGIRIYSLKEDPLNPKFLGYWDCGVPNSIGVHRFMYNGGRYVHLSCESDRFEGTIYRIVDIADPTNPVEAGNWWSPGAVRRRISRQNRGSYGAACAGFHGQRLDAWTSVCQRRQKLTWVTAETVSMSWT